MRTDRSGEWVSEREHVNEPFKGAEMWTRLPQL